MGKKKEPFPKAVRIMAWVSFWADVASEMVYPVIPLFIVGTLKAPAMVLGAQEGIAGILLNLVRGWSGELSDRLGKRVPFVQAGYALTCFSKPVTALAATWPMASAARLADRFGKGLRNTSRDALLADAIDKKDAGRAFGYHRAMDAAGAVVGSMIGFGLLTAFPERYRLIFAITAIPGFIAVGLTFLLKESRPPNPEPVTKSETKAKGPPVPLSPMFKKVLTVSLIFGLANSSDTFLLLRARELGLSDAMVVLAYALFNLVYSTSAYPLGNWSDKVGRRNILFIGWAVYAATYFGFAWTRAWGIWPLMALYGLYNGACDGTSKAWVKDVSHVENRGRAMGVYAMGTGFAGLAASLGAGLLWDKVDHQSPFLVGGCLAVLALAGLALTPTHTSTGPATAS